MGLNAEEGESCQHAWFVSQIQAVRHQLRAAVAQWLRCCATNRKVAGLIPAGVIGIFY